MYIIDINPSIGIILHDNYQCIAFIILLITIWGYLMFLYLCFALLHLKCKILKSKILSVLFVSIFLILNMMNRMEKVLQNYYLNQLVRFFTQPKQYYHVLDAPWQFEQLISWGSTLASLCVPNSEMEKYFILKKEFSFWEI